MAIKLNDGYTIRIHSKGVKVCMKKSQPGVFCDGRGEPVDEAIAREAGFDVEALKKEKLKQEKLAKMKEEIEKEFENITDEELEADYSVKHVGAGKYAVFGPDGRRVSDESMDQESANKLKEELENAQTA